MSDYISPPLQPAFEMVTMRKGEYEALRAELANMRESRADAITEGVRLATDSLRNEVVHLRTLIAAKDLALMEAETWILLYGNGPFIDVKEKQRVIDKTRSARELK